MVKSVRFFFVFVMVQIALSPVFLRGSAPQYNVPPVNFSPLQCWGCRRNFSSVGDELRHEAFECLVVQRILSFAAERLYILANQNFINISSQIAQQLPHEKQEVQPQPGLLKASKGIGEVQKAEKQTESLLTVGQEEAPQSIVSQEPLPSIGSDFLGLHENDPLYDSTSSISKQLHSWY